MNEHLPAPLRDALNGSFRLPSAIDADPIRLGRELRKSANCQTSRESTGCGMSDWKRVVCSCGWKGPKREGSDDYQSTKLDADEREHKEH